MKSPQTSQSSSHGSDRPYLPSRIPRPRISSHEIGTSNSSRTHFLTQTSKRYVQHLPRTRSPPPSPVSQPQTSLSHKLHCANIAEYVDCLDHTKAYLNFVRAVPSCITASSLATDQVNYAQLWDLVRMQAAMVKTSGSDGADLQAPSARDDWSPQLWFRKNNITVTELFFSRLQHNRVEISEHLGLPKGSSILNYRPNTEHISIEFEAFRRKRDCARGVKELCYHLLNAFMEKAPDETTPIRVELPSCNDLVPSPTSLRNEGLPQSSVLAWGTIGNNRTLTPSLEERSIVRVEHALDLPNKQKSSKIEPNIDSTYELSKSGKRDPRAKLQPQKQSIPESLQRPEDSIPDPSIAISYGLSTSGIFGKFRLRDYRSAMIKELQGFYAESGGFCAEFLRVVFSTPDNADDSFKSWALQACYTLSANSKIIDLPSSEFDRRFMGYIVIARENKEVEVQIWEMVEKNTEAGGGVSGSSEIKGRISYEARKLHDLRIHEPRDMQAFVTLHVQILEWGSTRYCTPYAQYLADHNAIAP